MTRWLVVGGGTAGSVVAARLSEDPANSVTLLEAGSDHRGAISRAGTPLVNVPELTDLPFVVRRPDLEPTRYLQGRGLGGSSLINGSIVVGDPSVWTAGHRMPLEPVSAVGPVGRAALASTPDARRVHLVARDGLRVTAADVYLSEAWERDNLEVRCDVSAVRLELAGRRCLGVHTSDGDHVEGDRVVLCAGAIGTPTLLLRSGVDAPGVGRRLQDHAGVAVTFDVHSDPVDGAPAIAVTVERPGRQLVVMDELPGDRRMGGICAGLLAVESAGSVSLPDPDGPPVVELHQLAVERDVDRLAAVVREAFELLGRVGFRDVIGHAALDDRGTSPEAVHDDEALRHWLRRHLGCYHHLAGSCRDAIGTDHGVIGRDNLFVCDASALARLPERNPFLVVVRLAEAAVARWSPPPSFKVPS